jgi:hypothetical protein
MITWDNIKIWSERFFLRPDFDDAVKKNICHKVIIRFYLKETSMFDENELNTLDLSVKQDNLYLEESFSDLDMASIRRLTPVKPNGLKDKSRKQIFVGHLNIMTPQGPIPIQAAIDARNLKEAMEMYPGTMKIALKKMKEEVEKLKEKQESRIIVPGS